MATKTRVAANGRKRLKRRMDTHIEGLKKSGFRGSIDTSMATRDLYSHDASMFELVPEAIIAPENSDDIKAAVNYVRETKRAHDVHISLTARSAGTDMSGGAINQSIILDMTKHFNKIFEVDATRAHAQPGVFYRDFERKHLNMVR